MKKWERIFSENIVENKWVTLKKNRVSLPNGIIIDDFYTIDISDASAVVAIDRNGNVILKKEFRYCRGKETIEVPAGAFEKNERPLDCAKRELLEETGYSSDNWFYLGETVDSPVKLTNKMHLFLATDCIKRCEQKLDDTEEIEVIITPLENAIQMIMDNRINCNSTISALMMANCYLIGKGIQI